MLPKNDQSMVSHLINNKATGQRVPAISVVKQNPTFAAIASKLNRPIHQPLMTDSKRDTENTINQGQLHALSNSTQRRIIDNDNTLQLFPDLELGIQILIGAILSPKDMVRSELLYSVNETVFNNELTMKLTDVVKKHMTTHYKLDKNAAGILRDCLFRTGSYINVVIPEASVDEIINNNQRISTENLSDLINSSGDISHIGFLGNNGSKTRINHSLEFLSPAVQMHSGYSKEVFLSSTSGSKQTVISAGFDVIDNHQALKLPLLKEVVRKQKVKALITKSSARKEIAAESIESGKLSNFEFSTLLYKAQPAMTETMVMVPTGKNAKRRSVGRPLTMKLPSEAVIPVHVPGDPLRHVCYFVLIDQEGYPITLSNHVGATDGLSNALQNSQNQGGLASLLIDRAKSNLAAGDANNQLLENSGKIYAGIVENELLARLKNGIYNENLEIANVEDIYRVMMSRALAGQFTRLLYIPAELVTYFAFRHYDNGIGKSLLDDQKVLTSLRAILLFSKVMAQVKNSISTTRVNMQLSPKDPDPKRTIEDGIHEVTRMRQLTFPVGINSPNDIVNWIQTVGLEFSFEGHPALPETKFEFEQKASQHVVPDSELDDNLRKQQLMGIGVPPEMVDNGLNVEFATSIVQNNILLSKRVIQFQEVLTECFKDMVSKIAMNDNVLYQELMDVFKQNMGLLETSLTDEEKGELKQNENSFVRDCVERFIEQLVIELPRPDMTTIENQKTAFESYKSALDSVLDSWISSEFFTSDLVGDISSNVDSIKATVKAYFIRKWQVENGFLTELNDLISSDEDGKPMLDLFENNKSYSEQLVKSCLRYIQSLRPTAAASNNDLQNMTVEPGTSSDSSGSGDDTSGDTGASGDDMFGDAFGGDDASGDMDLDAGSGEDNPEDESAQDKPTEEPKDETA